MDMIDSDKEDSLSDIPNVTVQKTKQKTKHEYIRQKKSAEAIVKIGKHAKKFRRSNHRQCSLRNILTLLCAARLEELINI